MMGVVMTYTRIWGDVRAGITTMTEAAETTTEAMYDSSTECQKSTW